MNAVIQKSAAPAGLPAAFDGQALRAVLGCFPTGVTVVTAMTSRGPIGITANSFTSVSLDPPLALVCIGAGSSRRRLIQDAGAFAVNILGEGQERVSRAFAAQPHEPFSDLSTKSAVTGAPILLDALAYLDCRIAGEFEAGDHVILLGEILDLGILRDDRPLVFFRSRYAKLRPPA
jgi:flavin reductase (DIM6/NTAB) family NADH-FMN oxidoreductase RutF